MSKWMEALKKAVADSKKSQLSTFPGHSNFALGEVVRKI